MSISGRFRILTMDGGLGNLRPKSQRGSRGGAPREQFGGKAPSP